MSSIDRYTQFTSPIGNGSKAGFDVHVYFHKVSGQNDAEKQGLNNLQDDDHEVRNMRAIRDAIKEEFPELQMYSIRDKAIGPHPLPMFEVDISTPAQFGAFIPWLAIHHGRLSVLIHPNTGDSRRDHTQGAIWIGDKLDLKLDTFEKEEEMDEVARRLEDMFGKERD
ncbi:MAG: hypothetical protein Q9172_004234 [Xanthocarpia lactea]